MLARFATPAGPISAYRFLSAERGLFDPQPYEIFQAFYGGLDLPFAGAVPLELHKRLAATFGRGKLLRSRFSRSGQAVDQLVVLEFVNAFHPSLVMNLQ